MATFSLTDRNNEIFSNIPSKYKGLIINNILAKSIESGLFLKEASYVLDSEKISEIKDTFNIKEKKITARKIIKNRIKSKEKDDEELDDFAGFD